MKYKILFIITIAFSLFFLSCSKEKGLSELTGSWNWIKTVGGIGGITQTPASTGKSITLVITHNKTYSLYTNNSLTSSGTFTYKNQQCIHDHKSKQVLMFSDPQMPEMMVENVSNNHLELAEDYYDGWIIEYQRK